MRSTFNFCSGRPICIFLSLAVVDWCRVLAFSLSHSCVRLFTRVCPRRELSTPTFSEFPQWAVILLSGENRLNPWEIAGPSSCHSDKLRYMGTSQTPYHRRGRGEDPPTVSVTGSLHRVFTNSSIISCYSTSRIGP